MEREQSLIPVSAALLYIRVLVHGPVVAPLDSWNTFQHSSSSIFAGTIARRLQFPNVDVPCPSEKDAPSIHCERRLLLKPLSLEAGAEVADAFQHVVAAQSTNWDDIMVDDAMYPLATAYKPQWALEAERPRGSEHTAIDVFGCKLTPGGPFELTLPWGCRPELFARTAAGEVAFNGELKSAGDRRTFDGVAAYLLLGMAQSLFDAPPDTWRFYSRPPVGYGIVGYPFAAHFVSVEMIGQIFVAPLSKPFILKSQDHASAAAALPPIDFGAPIDYKRDSLPIIADDETAVVWTAAPTEDGMFLKFLSVKTCSAAGRFASIFRLYQNYSRLPEERPAALLPAEMLFGFLCVAIRMRFVAGRVPTERELWTDPSILNPLAEAIAWLLRHGILYTDVRPPNVIVVETALAAAPKQVYLIDYDDAVLLQESELAAPLTQAAVAAILRGQKEEHAKVSLALWDDALTGAVLRHFPA